MNTVFYFASDRFQPTRGELDDMHDDYINPGIYALELGNFLSQALETKNFKTKFRCQEDWGHWLELEHEGAFKLAVGCSNMEAEDSSTSYHRIFVVPNRPFVRKLFKKIDVSAEVDGLEDCILQILEDDPSIARIQTEQGH